MTKLVPLPLGNYVIKWVISTYRYVIQGNGGNDQRYLLVKTVSTRINQVIWMWKISVWVSLLNPYPWYHVKGLILYVMSQPRHGCHMSRHTSPGWNWLGGVFFYSGRSMGLATGTAASKRLCVHLATLLFALLNFKIRLPRTNQYQRNAINYHKIKILCKTQ